MEKWPFVAINFAKLYFDEQLGFLIMYQNKILIAINRIHSYSTLTAFLLDPILFLSGAKQMRHPMWIRIGLQTYRMRLAEKLFEKSRTRKRSNLSDKVKKTIDTTGLAQFDDFLTEEKYKTLQDEIAAFKARVKPKIDQGDDRGGNYKVWELSSVDNTQYPILSDLCKNKFHSEVLAYVQGFVPPIWQISPLLQETSWSMELEVDDPNCHFHSDHFTHTAKGFYFIDDVTIDGAPFEYVEGSHLFDNQRISNEGSSFRTGMNESLRINTTGKDITTKTVSGNTLLFADTAGLHRRRPPESVKSRTIIYFNGGGQKPAFMRRLF